MPPYSEEAKWALSDALAVALEFGHNYIGTEHLLLATVPRNPDSLAGPRRGLRALESTARAHVIDLLRQIHVHARPSDRVGPATAQLGLYRAHCQTPVVH